MKVFSGDKAQKTVENLQKVSPATQISRYPWLFGFSLYFAMRRRLGGWK
jgi:hypothetical protein